MNSFFLSNTPHKNKILPQVIVVGGMKVLFRPATICIFHFLSDSDHPTIETKWKPQDGAENIFVKLRVNFSIVFENG